MLSRDTQHRQIKIKIGPGLRRMVGFPGSACFVGRHTSALSQIMIISASSDHPQKFILWKEVKKLEFVCTLAHFL